MRAGIVADEALPDRQVRCEVATPGLVDAEIVGRRLGRLAVGKELRNTAVAALQRIEPVAEVDAGAGDFGRAGRAILDNDLGPFVFGIVVVEPLDDEVLQSLAVGLRDILAVHLPPTRRPSRIWAMAYGRDGRVGEIGLLQLDKPAEGDQGVRDGLLNFVLPILAADVPQSDLGVGDDRRQEGEELAVPATTGSGLRVKQRKPLG